MAGIGKISSPYLFLYKYLPVLDAAQITKIRKIAIGLSPVSAFSDNELAELEIKLARWEKGGT